MIYPPELEAILERPNTTDERKYSRLDVIDAYNLMKQQADGMQLERDIQQELAMKAREAGRREGHLDALQALVTGLGMDINVRALLDSPKAEGEEPSDDYVAWLQFRQRSFRVCDSDAGGAFRVYRHPKEAEGEETK